MIFTRPSDNFSALISIPFKIMLCLVNLKYYNRIDKFQVSYAEYPFILILFMGEADVLIEIEFQFVFPREHDKTNEMPRAW
jgi:hypothetical protein